MRNEFLASLVALLVMTSFIYAIGAVSSFLFNTNTEDLSGKKFVKFGFWDAVRDFFDAIVDAISAVANAVVSSFGGGSQITETGYESFKDQGGCDRAGTCASAAYAMQQCGSGDCQAFETDNGWGAQLVRSGSEADIRGYSTGCTDTGPVVQRGRSCTVTFTGCPGGGSEQGGPSGGGNVDPQIQTGSGPAGGGGKGTNSGGTGGGTGEQLTSGGEP
ncbi:MAG: hypothetical protein HYW26_00165 [Candidatus Aenigmarchaeota archaeon]|nr:hypothetical protein [Candidatus Aenigmarchaeota archaeon]